MIINPGQTAFFRTLYPESLLQALLVSPLLKSVDLAGIVSDQFSFIQAGLLTATAVRINETTSVSLLLLYI